MLPWRLNGPAMGEQRRIAPQEGGRFQKGVWTFAPLGSICVVACHPRCLPDKDSPWILYVGFESVATISAQGVDGHRDPRCGSSGRNFQNSRSSLSCHLGVESVESFESPYQFDQHGTYAVLTLNPLINEGQWSNVSEVGNEILSQLQSLTAGRLVVDLSRLEYMGSPQVALLVRIWKSLRKLPGKMAVQCPSPTVREILCTAGLRSLWDIVEGREAALKSLGVPSKCRSAASIWNWFRTGVVRLSRLRPS